MARNADEPYRWTPKESIFLGPTLFFPLWTEIRPLLDKPSKEKLRKRVAAKLAKAKDLPPEERTIHGPEI